LVVLEKVIVHWIGHYCILCDCDELMVFEFELIVFSSKYFAHWKEYLL